ncbi:hypothetical protein [Ornithinibacillus sp. 179-J 7C1 HS]|uniref:hypothetical protein n=1 Tax=Ornithinibacillus sp. 179-J 7C1 HS TaxID=3142384 RepID=UPI0039A34558
MKKKIWWLTAILTIGTSYCLITLFLYEPSDNLYGFPVPKNAELTRKDEKVESYNWSRASEENGIPFSYEMVLKVNGWTKGERLGASVVYTKDDYEITLISTTKQLDFIKPE